jgi:hypothetical protein
LAARTLAASLLFTQAVLLLYGARVHFPTRNEVAHVPAGLAVWQAGTFSLYRVNPPLPRMLAALPPLLARPDTSCLDLIHAPGPRPNVLAHAQLATPDIPATVSGFAATYVFWRYLRRPGWEYACYAGLLLGLAQLTKFTLLVLYAVWPALWLLRGLGAGASQAVPLRPRVAQGALIVLLSLLVLNAGYAFDGTGRPLGDYAFVSRTFTGVPPADDGAAHAAPLGNRFRGTWLAVLPVPLPADYLSGIDLQRRDLDGHMPPSFLAGRWSDHGWWYYYLYALAVKVPLGTWLLVLWALLLTLLRRPGSAGMLDELALVLPAFSILALVSAHTGFSHHMRYVLPMFPFVLVSTGKLGYYLHTAPRKAGAAVLALLL